MLTIYNSNNISVLKELMLSLMDMDPLEGVFSKEQILVQSSGMSKYLLQQIAERNGICANISFPMVSSFVWRIYHSAIDDAPETSSFTKKTMRWYLVRMIPELLSHKEFQKLKNYVGHEDSPVKHELNVHQLANQIADLFDGYQVYRPEMLINWDNDELDLEELKGQEWQPLLWKLLCENIKKQTNGEPHRAELYIRFLREIESGTIGRSDFGKLPDRIWIFGVPTMPPSQMKTIEALGTLLDVHYMSLNPCHLYWGDIKDRSYVHKHELKLLHEKLSNENNLQPIEQSDLFLGDSTGNPILSSFGKLGRDHIAMVSELEHKEEISAFVETPDESLLGHIKNDILQLRDNSNLTESESSTHKRQLSHTDMSVVVRDCYSPIREVEELQRHLLELFNNDPDLKPRDVIVMCADIDKYSPHITSVFSTPPYFDERFIPYSVSDRTAQSEHPIIASFCKIIDVATTRYTASDVLTLLKNKAVLEKFGFEDAEYDDLYALVNEVGIRWGLDETTSTGFGLPAMTANTWSFGVTRLLLGLAMDSECGSYQDYLPFSPPINVSSETIGKLASFIDALKEAHSLLEHEDTCAGWHNKIISIASMFFQPTSNQESSAIDVIKRAANALLDSTNAAHFDEEINFRIIGRELIQELSNEQLSQRFLAGQLNFCTLMPMRSIPFKVVCLLGMNDGAYPVVTPENKDDLVVLHPKRGDRDRRESDRFLFLEAMLSAEQQLYISYTGHSVKSGELKNKSILVQELIDYIASCYCLEGDTDLCPDHSEDRLVRHLVKSLPMTPYSLDNFKSGCPPHFFSEWKVQESDYLPKDFCPNPLDEDEKELSEGDGVYKLNLSELMKFWKSPPKHFFARRLKSDINVNSLEIKDDEPFNLSHLDRYQVRSQWLSELLADRNVTDPLKKQTVFEKLRKECQQNGVSPVGAMGAICMSDEKNSIEKLGEEIESLMLGECVHEDINLTLTSANGDYVRLVGTIRDTFPHHALCYRGGNVRIYDIFDGWIRQLALSSSGHCKHVVVMGLNDSYTIYPLAREEATELLTQLMEIYYIGLRAPLPYLPDVAEKGLKATQLAPLEDKNSYLAMKSMKNEYLLNYENNKLFGDRSPERAFGGWSDELAEKIHEWGLEVLLPCLDHTKKGLLDEVTDNAKQQVSGDD